MKKIVITWIFLMAFPVLFAQSYVPSREDITAFFNTTTLVVLDDSPISEYNTIISGVMEQEWNVTDFDFISNKEFEEKRFDPAYSFIYSAQVTFENDKTDARYRFLHLTLGGDYFRLNEMPDLASVPLAYHSVDEDRYSYKLAILVRFIQNHVMLIREHPEIVSSNVFKYYNNNIREIRDKILYLLEEEIAPEIRNTSGIQKVYPYNFQMVTMEDIEEAIKRRDPDVVFLHKVGPEGTKLNARSYKIIIGAANANFYYFDYHMISNKNPDGFLESDFKKLAR
ncbi:MAG: hypothetical protein JXB19_12375 [Bacteroidales bacterium]|nr:hypothetical protein [Bacteroidales bacterium]